MKRLIGGLFLLNLCSISLGLTAGEVSISDEEVLSQLLELRNFIDDKRDFTKGFKDLKPVLVQYRSSASKIDGVVPCNLSFNTDALHLSIAGYSVQADGTPITLRINVVYEWTNYVGYTIKTAKLEATNNLAVETIKQSKPNFELDISENSFNWGNANLEGEHVYAKIEEYNNILYVVISHKVTNTSENTIALPNSSMTITLPDEVAEKIIDFDGKSVKETNVRGILGFNISRGSTSYPDVLNDRCSGVLQNTNLANKCQLNMFVGANLNAGDTMLFSMRFFITL